MGIVDCRLQHGRELSIFGGVLHRVPVAQRIARWTSNPKVVGSIPTRDGPTFFTVIYFIIY